jgi:hypothetical protein
MAHDVFISHSSKDKLTADAICHALEQQSISCWIAPRDVRPGSDYPSEIITGIENAKLMVLIFSEESNDSQYVYAEVERAFSKGKTIIPYRLSTIEMNRNLEFLLSGKHWIDAYHPNDTEFLSLIKATRDALKKLKEQPTKPTVRLFDLDWQFEQRFQSPSASTASEIELADDGTTLVIRNDFYEIRKAKTQLTLEPDSVYDFAVDVRMEGYEHYPKDAEAHPEITAGAHAIYESFYSKNEKVCWFGNSYNEEKWARIRWTVHTSNEKRTYALILENGGGIFSACKGTAYFRNLTYKKT